MNNHNEDQDFTMQSSNDTSTGQEDHKEELKNPPPVASAEQPAEQPPIRVPVLAAGSKELRVQLQEQEQNDDESEEEAVAEAVVADEDDDDGDAVMAAVVVEEDEDASLAQSITTDAPTKKAKATNKPKKTSRKSTRTTQDRLAAATEARNMLVDTVPRLPVLVSDSHVVRSFGRIKVDSQENKFSSANALYPVGFSCDRYEFSPVHGRVLKMRCTIFDGKKVKEKQQQCGRIPSADIPDGPIFRIMWGQGVDEDVDIVDYPYDVYSASAPLSDGTKVEAVTVTSREMDDLEPEEGMRVRVRFERGVWFSGTVVSVGDDEFDPKKKQTLYDIRIHYDDGSMEDTRFPDPDISIYLPGDEDGFMENGIVEIDELRGKPVTSVIGTTPLRAWGKALIKLGLIDEVILQSALEAREIAQAEGRAEAEEKLENKKAQRQQTRSKVLQKQVDAMPVEDESATEGTKPQNGELIKEEERAEKTGSGPVESDELPRKDEAKSESATELKSSGDAIDMTKNGKREQPIAVSSSGVDSSVNGEKAMPQNDGPRPENVNELKEEEGIVGTIEAEPASEAEMDLRRQVEQLQGELATLQAEDREASIALADARIATIGPFLINPFQERGATLTQESQWLSAAIRKEKSKMGSTGNKRKIVTATDLLERNDTFFNSDIEALVEGLPGSEYCTQYIFHAFRAGGAAVVSQAWVHEARLRQEREREKHARSASKSKVDESQLREKDRKRRRREDERDARKRQKQGEMDEKKKARAEERMTRLNVQVDERLFKEACFQREKVILLLAKNLAKDFAVRRKAAELISAQTIVDNRSKKNDTSDAVAREIPSMGRVYDEDVLRVWDFFTTFGSMFLERGYLPSIPSLDSLQDAIDVLRDGRQESLKSRSDAIEQLVQIAIALCHPLAATLTRYLFASLIALNPALQKDFGAAFFNEVNASASAKDDSEGSAKSVLPLNKMTWQEVARLTFLSDSLGEIGYSRQDSAHLLRGYRSGGHPNSKESKRLRRSEDYWVALLRQELSERESLNSPAIEGESSDFKIRVLVPCIPSASPNQWIFYLHNVKSLPVDSLKPTKDNVRKAIALLESDDLKKTADSKSSLADLGRGLALLDGIKAANDLSPADIQSCLKARQMFLRVLDRASGEVFTSDVIGSAVHKDDTDSKGASGSDAHLNTVATVSSNRQRMGLLNTLSLTDKEFKKYSQLRGEYMAEALRLKEELNEVEGEDDDDDEEEDDDEDADGDKKMAASDTATSSKQPVVSGVDQKDDKAQEPGAIVGEQENAEGIVDNGEDSVPKKPETSGRTRSDESKEVIAAVVENGDSKGDSDATAIPEKPASPLDEFCGDMPGAPEPIRRCLAVLRTLCKTESAEPFLYPVDPQSNPGYYEVILKPMCFREIGVRLRDAASLYMRQSPAESAGSDHGMQKEVVESIVAQFARNVRLISQNSACYVNAGAMVVCAGEEMLRIFERLMFDWVLAPKEHLSPLELLDDDRCVEPHPSDEGSLILLCDGCEGKYNMSRLDPPVYEVPKGNWYCPRCVSGRCWETLDPRIGRSVKSEAAGAPAREGIVRRCVFGRPEGHNTKSTLLYEVEFGGDVIEIWTLAEVDAALARIGEPVEPVRCVEAVAESPGYGMGTDRGIFHDLVPVPLNPRVSYTAGEAAVSSSVYRDTVAGSGTLRLISPEEMTAHEWLRLLVLLITKCSSSELMQSLVGKMENEAAEEMAKRLGDTVLSKKVQEVLPSIDDHDNDSVEDTEDRPVSKSSGLDDDGSTVMTVKAESVDELDDSAMIIDASAVEVVTEMETEPVAVADIAVSAVTLNPSGSKSSDGEIESSKRAKAFFEKEKRSKAREDSIAAFCIKNELRPTVSSFEEDVVSQVVDSTLATKEQGLALQACRCRGMVCDFCGLSDVALGSPLVRAPNSEEWDELMPHAARSRRTFAIAELPNKKKLASLTIRVGGEIVSEEAKRHDFDGIADGGMTELLPTNEKGFQDELKFRSEYDLPFVTGSLSAHECCAIAVHDARKECLLKEYAEKEAYLIEWDSGMACGRTLPLGRDASGRSYWKFKADSSLFVCANETVMNGNMNPRKLWYKFGSPEEIASLLYFLGTDKLVSELKRTFPAASRLLKSRKWTELLLKRRFPVGSRPLITSGSNESSLCDSSQKERTEEVAEDNSDDEQPYEENDEVLVESRCGKLLWNAKIVGVSQAKDSGKVNGYRVHYDEWSSRFDEWVTPFRVVERIENNVAVQAEMFGDTASLRDGIPHGLENMVAKKFLRAKDRSRGSAPVPSFSEVARVEPTASTGKKTFGMLKAALLLMEAALPLGAVDTSAKGQWNPSLASEWRSAVKNARGPASLMRCLILLESSLSLEWVDTHYSHLISCLPIGWKAINEATVGSIALRIFLIDQGLHYDEVDK